MYIKLKNNNIEKYPYYSRDLLSENPNTSFPEVISDDLYKEWDIYPVKVVQQPNITYKQNISEGVPEFINNEWTQTWIITDKLIEEINSIQESNRKEAYREESDPLFFKWQRGEIEKQVWLDKVAEIKQRWS
jgi:hypothetical protein